MYVKSKYVKEDWYIFNHIFNSVMNSGYVDTDMLPGSYPYRKYMVCMV